jgi:hypothetical protein
MNMRDVAIPIDAWNGPNPNQGIFVNPTTMTLLKVKMQPMTKKYKRFPCNRTAIRDGRWLSFIPAVLEVAALYNASPKRMNSYTVAGIHNVQWPLQPTRGHPRRGNPIKGSIVSVRRDELMTRIPRNSPMEMRKRIPLKKATFLEQLKRA